MLRDDEPGSREHQAKLSRRGFMVATTLAATGAAIAGTPITAAAQEPLVSADRPVLAYVGSYSSPQGPEGSKGYGRGIYLFEMNPASGALTQRAVFATDANPSWLALNPARTHLYAANETATFQGAKSGSVSAYAIDRANGHLTLINTVSSEGAGPAHCSVHPAGKHVFVANYAGGTVAVLPVDAHGGLPGAATDIKTGRGDKGLIRAAGRSNRKFRHQRP